MTKVDMFGNEYYSTEEIGMPEDMVEFINQQLEDMEEMNSWQTFDGYQDFSDETAIYPDENAQEYLMLGLTSEVGELAGKMKKQLRDGTVLTDEDFAKELGDVLWYVAQLASNRELYLSEVAQMNVEKLSSRKERGTLTGSGDYR
jgi:NTP pyrophosphatase (non-canonical NTP hydrolase)